MCHIINSIYTCVGQVASAGTVALSLPLYWTHCILSGKDDEIGLRSVETIYTFLSDTIVHFGGRIG